MTAGSVRRGDTSRSPMLKVMDLFRHRSNSAVSEADKRKAVSTEIYFKNYKRLYMSNYKTQSSLLYKLYENLFLFEGKRIIRI